MSNVMENYALHHSHQQLQKVLIDLEDHCNQKDVLCFDFAIVHLVRGHF
jgi:hypothetical protein